MIPFISFTHSFVRHCARYQNQVQCHTALLQLTPVSQHPSKSIMGLFPFIVLFSPCVRYNPIQLYPVQPSPVQSSTRYIHFSSQVESSSLIDLGMKSTLYPLSCFPVDHQPFPFPSFAWKKGSIMHSLIHSLIVLPSLHSYWTILVC